MTKKIIVLLFLLLIVSGTLQAASYDGVAPKSEDKSKEFLVGLAGKPVWLDKNGSKAKTGCFAKMNNIEHLILNNIDIDNGTIELIRDNGEKFYWNYTDGFSFYQKAIVENYKKYGPSSPGQKLNPPAVDLAQDVQWLFYFQNPFELHPDWSDRAWNSIKDQKVYLGMNQEMCIYSWGKPRKVNQSIGSWGTHEQWVYGDFGPYVYFQNGVLTSIQD